MQFLKDFLKQLPFFKEYAESRAYRKEEEFFKKIKRMQEKNAWKDKDLMISKIGKATHSLERELFAFENRLSIESEKKVEKILKEWEKNHAKNHPIYLWAKKLLTKHQMERKKWN